MKAAPQLTRKGKQLHMTMLHSSESGPSQRQSVWGEYQLSIAHAEGAHLLRACRSPTVSFVVAAMLVSTCTCMCMTQWPSASIASLSSARLTWIRIHAQSHAYRDTPGQHRVGSGKFHTGIVLSVRSNDFTNSITMLVGRDRGIFDNGG
ncbi:hypothetical protein BU23DRAFT_125947 [Bimuria novae-zelandiae CBS 107.79]|uniref:Uncharacterized protein n=1 Tax=Bimuria novae-zelandiae CBS 107.79 TaxID=1447943 RepID=A0A6A5V9Q9_9PLEO|nr:hypothetical protein BU23DRAFT_125947 [Bimuria novae-zelandiae CBS 107.79]